MKALPTALSPLLSETLKNADLLTPSGSEGKHPEGASIYELKQSALDRLRTVGLPGPRDESWRVTRLRALTDVPFRPERLDLRADELLALSKPWLIAEAQAWVFPIGPVSGARQGKSPRAGEPASGIEFWSVKSGLPAPDWAKPCLATSSERDDAPFVALNAANLNDLWCFRLRAGSPRLQIVYPVPTVPDAAIISPRVHVVVEGGTSAHLVELYLGDKNTAPTFSNAASTISLHPDSKLEHCSLSWGNAESRQLSTVRVELGRNGRYLSHSVRFGGALSRSDHTVTLNGEGASAELQGLTFATAGDEIDHHTLVDHQLPHAESRQKFKALVADRGHSVLDARVRVAKGAHGTAAHQESRNLLLDEGGVVHTKPHLEIDNDDVSCSHGATIGSLRPEELFYLQSRGIDPKLAKSLLVRAFATDILDTIWEPARALCNRELSARLENAALSSELEA